MTIYDDARAAVASLVAANQHVSDTVTGHSDLISVDVSTTTVGVLASRMEATIDVAEAAATPMPLIKGLFSEGMGVTLPSVANVSCNVHWSDLQPTQGGPIADNNFIDRLLASGLPGRVRLYFGRYSPSWALALGKVHVFDPTDGNQADVPRWWEADVQAAQADLVTKLAAKYDGKISAIFVANGGSIYAEPFIRGITSPATRQNLVAAGYTSQLDKLSYLAGYQMFSAFKKTRLAQAFNPWQFVNPDGTPGSDVVFTNAMIDKFRSLFGDRAIIQNNSIRTPALAGYKLMYDHMNGSKPLSFQTATKDRIGSWTGTLDWAVAHGAHAVELTPGYVQGLTATQLAHYDAALRAN